MKLLNLSINMKNAAMNIRLSDETKHLIKLAAQLQGTNISSFFIQCATEKAHKIINSQSNFILSDEAFKKFTEILDRKPVLKSNLSKLIHKKSVFCD